MEKTREEFAEPRGSVTGEVAIGCGETQIMREIARVAIPLQREHPGIRFSLYSAYADDVAEKLDRGLLDFGLMFEPFDTRRYETLLLPFSDEFGFLMRTDHPLAKKESLRMEDVEGEPLLFPSQGQSVGLSTAALRSDHDAGRLNIVCRYNLLFNAALKIGAHV